jgi:hypothetical protein
MPDHVAAKPMVSPANTQLDRRDLPMDDSPLPQANPWDSNRRSVDLKQVNADCLVLEPRRWSSLWHLPLVLAASAGGLAGVVYSVVEELQGNTSLIGLLILGIGMLLVVGVFVLGVIGPPGCRRWIRFDRRTGLMTISRRPLRLRRTLEVEQSRPLTEMAGVQLLYVGWQSENLEVGEPGTPGSVVYKSYHSYQLNLVLRDSETPRLNLISHSDASWMRAAGQQLADFLRVPLVNQLPTGH